MRHAALIIDDDRSERRLIANILQQKLKLPSFQACNGQEALDFLRKEHSQKIVVVVLDMHMPIMNGIETMRNLTIHYPNVPVIIITGSQKIEDAIEAMHMKAIDFLIKPVDSDKMEDVIGSVLKTSTCSQKNIPMKSGEIRMQSFQDLIGWDKGLSNCISMGRKAASCDLPVLIEGKTGTGKEIFSTAIHAESIRSSAPFITINCGAIPEKLVESILFGHEKGAFTGAIARNAGKFQEADGGTIFLDEIGELPLDAQVKLLRTLQEKEVEPVGAVKSIPVNVRIISATNRDLLEEVKKGRFREDLYYRLNVLQIKLPSLAERREDIHTLIKYFIEKCHKQQGVPIKNMSNKIIESLTNRDWPGNVRELENLINRLVVMGDDNYIFNNLLQSKIDAPFISKSEDHEGSLVFLEEDGSFKQFDQLEREIIRKALLYCDNNMSRTARTLGIAKSTLYAKLNGIIKPE